MDGAAENQILSKRGVIIGALYMPAVVSFIVLTAQSEHAIRGISALSHAHKTNSPIKNWQ